MVIAVYQSTTCLSYPTNLHAVFVSSDKLAFFFGRLSPPPPPRPPPLQANKANPEYKGVFDCGQKIFRAYGIRGAYQGFSAVLLRNVPCFGSYFFCSEVGEWHVYALCRRLMNVAESRERRAE